MPKSIMSKNIERRRNLAPWAGLFIGLVSILSNGAFFLGIPGQSAIPFLSWTLAVIALVFALTGVIRPFRQPQMYGGKVSSSVLAVVTVLIVGLTAFASVHSRDLPGSAGAPQPGQKAPDFTLADTSGNKVSLGQLLGSTDSSLAGSGNSGSAAGAGGVSGLGGAAPKAVLLIFYRGYW